MVGNIPNFQKIDVLRCLLLIEKHVSRNELMRKLELGEGTVRTILDTLKWDGLLESSRQGHKLTLTGQSFVNNVRHYIELLNPEIEQDPFKKKKVAAIQLKTDKLPEITFWTRDIAIKHGADGALLFIYKDKKIQLPGIENFDYKPYKDLFDFSEGNVMVVTFASSYRQATNAALAVVMELDDELRKAVNSA